MRAYKAQAGRCCCYWGDFELGFMEAFQRLFHRPPTADEIERAVYDWKHASTGWEAAQIAKGRIKAAEARAAQRAIIDSSLRIGRHIFTFLNPDGSRK